MENYNTVTLDKNEYDELQDIKREYERFKNAPKEYTIFRIPTYGYGRSEVQFRELEVYSTSEAVMKLKEDFEESISNLNERLQEDASRVNELQQEMNSFVSAFEKLRAVSKRVR